VSRIKFSPSDSSALLVQSQLYVKGIKECTKLQEGNVNCPLTTKFAHCKYRQCEIS